MNEDRAWDVIVEELRSIRRALERKPDLRQGTVSSPSAGPPRTCTVTIGGEAYPGVRVLDGYVPSNGDATWVLILPGGVRIAIGDLP